MPLFNLDGLRYAFQSVQFCSVLIYKQVFFSLSTVVCLSPPSNIQRSFKVREKEKRIFILFLFIYLWNFVHRLKIAPVVYYKRTPYIIIAQRKLIQLTATFVCETWQRNRERQKEKKCATNFFSLFSCGKYNATDGDGYIEFENRNNYRPESVNGLCQH